MDTAALREPWFRSPTENEQPFRLSRMLRATGRTFQSLACFPWTPQSLASLWDGYASSDPDLSSKWDLMVQQWMGAIAVGGNGSFYIFTKLGSAKPIHVPLPDCTLDVMNIAWAINSNDPLRPLLVLTVTSVIVIFDVISRSIVGRLRGHGGPITSLAVHPSHPHLFCTTSRDFTARIYDLSLQPVQRPNNPCWLPNTQPSLAGPAHGLHMNEPEGEGIGQCVAVMVGGRSGGHQGAVLCSAFHPSQPLIATGGMDRAVKIWRIPPSVFNPPQEPQLAREDKPLFSTDLLHKARVWAVDWLADDIITSCSAPALMRRNADEPEDTYWEDGTVGVWQWLGFNRFFPPGKIPQKVMRGTASDWRNSESFKILAAYHLPTVVKRVHVYRSLTHDPMLLMPIGKTIRIFNMSLFKPRTPPKFPLDVVDLSLQMTTQMHIGEDNLRDTEKGSTSVPESTTVDGDARGDEALPNVGDGEGEKRSRQRNSSVQYPPPAPLAALFESVEGWAVTAELQRRDGHPDIPDITVCAMGFEGLRIVGIGQNGTLFVWRLREQLLS
ncbi:WD40 repeat-like protein [Polyporus arcularius HHB13444]|uniref:WD40 repeat-like protein n=1 Tax=Polyporus arcularius HHB13444 TaxID=1314778 RepID=A0A5C3Q2N5_9APHY|nr:WD40 repeat-like protein [Polyporus arcularius HHB13444]